MVAKHKLINTAQAHRLATITYLKLTYCSLTTVYQPTMVQRSAINAKSVSGRENRSHDTRLGKEFLVRLIFRLLGKVSCRNFGFPLMQIPLNIAREAQTNLIMPILGKYINSYVHPSCQQNKNIPTRCLRSLSNQLSIEVRRRERGPSPELEPFAVNTADHL